MIKKSMACGIVGLLISYNIINYKPNYTFPHPTIDIKIEKRADPINENTDKDNSKTEIIDKNYESEYYVAKISVNIDEKQNFLDFVMKKPYLTDLSLLIEGKDNEYEDYKYDNRNHIKNSVVLDQDYKIIARATYSNDEMRIVYTGVDKSAIKLYKNIK